MSFSLVSLESVECMERKSYLNTLCYGGKNWSHCCLWRLSPPTTTGRVADPVCYIPDPDPTSQDDPDPDTSVLKIVHLFYDEF